MRIASQRSVAVRRPQHVQQFLIVLANTEPLVWRRIQVRVVDESGEDYLYPAEYFVPVKLPAAIAEELVSRLTALS